MLNKQLEKFYIGTIFNFTGLFFLTILPVIVGNLSLYIEPIMYKTFAVFFLVLTGIFYALSQDFINRQLVIIGMDFIIFAIFQFIFLDMSKNIFPSTGFISLFVGICLLVFEHFSKD